MRRAPLVFLPLTVVLVSGCGAAPAPKSAMSHPPRATTRQHAQLTHPSAESSGSAVPGSGTVIYFGTADSSPRPPRELYAVFRRPPRSSDGEVQRLAREEALLDFIGEPTTVAASLGKPMYGDTRLLLGNVSRGVYALPTTNGAICVSAFPRGGGGCMMPGGHGLSVAYDDASQGRHFRLYGLVADEVRGVDVVVDGATQKAELGENGYRLELADVGWGRLQRLVLHLRDGATEAIPLHP